MFKGAEKPQSGYSISLTRSCCTVCLDSGGLCIFYVYVDISERLTQLNQKEPYITTTETNEHNATAEHNKQLTHQLPSLQVKVHPPLFANTQLNEAS